MEWYRTLEAPRVPCSYCPAWVTACCHHACSWMSCNLSLCTVGLCLMPVLCWNKGAAACGWQPSGDLQSGCQGVTEDQVAARASLSQQMWPPQLLAADPGSRSSVRERGSGVSQLCCQGMTASPTPPGASLESCPSSPEISFSQAGGATLLPLAQSSKFSWAV